MTQLQSLKQVKAQIQYTKYVAFPVIQSQKMERKVF